MELGLFFQLLINGLLNGGMYALVASGFTLILGVIQIFNFAQGHFYMLGAFITYGVFIGLGLPYPIAVIAAMIVTFLLGALLYVGIIRWTMPSGFFHMMLVTISVGTLISQASFLTFGYQEKVISPILPTSLKVIGVVLNPAKLIVIGLALIVMMALYFFMKTKLGTAMLAAAENREVAALMGINTHRIFWVTMGVGCALCGIAGGFVLPILGASTAMAFNIFSRAMFVVIIGGMGSISGALLAAFCVGIVESFAFHFLGHLNMIIIFLFMAILIYFRPGGLLGKPLPVPGE